MVQVYVDLILKGKKTIDDVPERIREQVRKALEDLIDEEEYKPTKVAE